MLTLKEKLDHGDLDDVLTRDEIKQILDLFETAEDLDLLDEARDEAHDEGREEGLSEGKQEGEEAEFERLKERYIEIRDERVGDVVIPEFGILRELITGLDELFEVDNG